MIRPNARDVYDPLRQAAMQLHGRPGDYDSLLARIGDARIVLIGEASHGTHEFYAIRAALTHRLIREKAFTAVAVEADWPDALRINRYVQHMSADRSVSQALGDFIRFPVWMWRNRVVEDFVEQLRRHNDALNPSATKVGFYGLDLYSLHASIHHVLGYLERVDPAGARRARVRYGCFEDFSQDPQGYGLAVAQGYIDPCEHEAVMQLMELSRRSGQYVRRDGPQAADEAFYAEQNARLVRNAEQYYRAMFRGRANSWNLRDTYMADTLDALLNYLENRDGHARVVVWAHNSHLGDARATEMARNGEVNLGQLVRERHPGEVFSIGFTTHAGTVTAADDWNSPHATKNVQPSLPGSVERAFHELGLGDFYVLLRPGDEAFAALQEPMLERAIGVIYRPQSERISHYFDVKLPEQFDAVIHIDQSRAVEPLPAIAPRKGEDVPETYPTGV